MARRRRRGRDAAEGVVAGSVPR